MGIEKFNVQAYADDFLVFCPTASGMRKLLAKMELLLNQYELLLNVDKTKIMIFGKPSSNNITFFINGKQIEIVSQYKYLGCIISDDLYEAKELDRIVKNFNKSVGMLIRKFSSVDIRIKLQLFESLCMSFYGLETIVWRKNCSAAVRKLGVAYHYMSLKVY